MKHLLWCNKVPRGKRNKLPKVNGVTHQELVLPPLDFLPHPCHPYISSNKLSTMFIKRSSDCHPLSGLLTCCVWHCPCRMYTSGSVYDYTNVSRRAIANLMLNPNLCRSAFGSTPTASVAVSAIPSVTMLCLWYDLTAHFIHPSFHIHSCGFLSLIAILSTHQWSRILRSIPRLIKPSLLTTTTHVICTVTLTSTTCLILCLTT